MLLNVRERWRPSRDFEVASQDLFQLGESLALWPVFSPPLLPRPHRRCSPHLPCLDAGSWISI